MPIRMEQIYQPEDLVDLVTWLAEKKYGHDSTSISYEAAESLMDAVMYCIRAYEHAAYGLEKKQNATTREAYRIGYHLVQKQVLQVKALYEQQLSSFQDYGVACLHDTVLKGIPAFLQRYDVRFYPQNTLLTLDYPILQDLSGKTGVNAVLPYMQAIVLEQQFLSRFSRAYVEEVLSAYHCQYTLLIENICSILLGNIFGHLLLQKPLSQKGFCEQEYQQIGTEITNVTKEKLEQTLHLMLERLVKEWYEADGALQQYLERECSNLAVRIKTAAETNGLQKLFLL